MALELNASVLEVWWLNVYVCVKLLRRECKITHVSIALSVASHETQANIHTVFVQHMDAHA
jgi:hypothetical protein